MSWQTLLTKQVQFLQSAEFEARVQSEDSEMKPMLPKMIQMNKLGFFTNDSQLGIKYDFRKRTIDYTMKQRSYVSGLMHESLAKKFIAMFNTETDKCAICVPIVCTAPRDITIPKELDLPLTITTNEKHKTVAVETRQPPVMPYGSLRSISPLFAEAFPETKCKAFVKSGEIVSIFCWDPVFVRNTLFNDICRILKQIN